MARQTGADEQGEGRPGPSADEPSTLEILLDNLGRDVIQVAGASAGLDALVGEPVIYDVGEHSTISRNAVVLAGAYKPRMLALVGRKADGWLASMPYLGPGDLEAGNAAIDEAAVAAGRDPREIRRLLNTGPMSVDDVARLALEDGVGTFILVGDDEAVMRGFAEEVAPAVCARVQRDRRRSLG